MLSELKRRLAYLLADRMTFFELARLSIDT